MSDKIKIAHIGIATYNIETTVKKYIAIPGMVFEGIEEVPSEGVRTAMLKVGDAHLEFLEPLNVNSPVKKFLDTRGEGIHHIAFEVESFNEVEEFIRTQTLTFLPGYPKIAEHGKKVAFLHPKSMNGVLVEFVSRESTRTGNREE